ncbi:uncharacterized protein LOC111911634 [Lactuca sativa]|uniref:uncharacterized protein LOC111911634 n=1 Tax=Lactuca sativa TaxID=4236 RepID=UPI000CD80F8F|nr:uncharacterized protein LOC111911634 [Lactuca sativa]
MKVGINIEDVILKEVGTGEKTMFWHDRWTGNMTLKASFPEMYKLERHKHCMVNERILPGGLVWNWKASITSPEQIREADLLLNRVSNIQLGTRNDKWVCKLSNDGVFHVEDLRLRIDRRDMQPGEVAITWTHDVPLKVNCFMWRAYLDRIPTACAFIKRGIQVTSPTCTFCEDKDEDVAHVLLQCPMVAKVWEWVFQWCGIPGYQFCNMHDLVKFTTQWGSCPKKRRCLVNICYGTIWHIWKARCDWIFKKIRPSPAKVVDLIKSNVFIWSKYRRSQCSMQWIEWCVNPICCL